MILFEGRICGVIGFNWIDSLNQSCEVGYWVSEDSQKLGIITRSTRSLVNFAFADLEMNRINIPVAVRNTKSRAIPERLGFSEEGISREAEWLYDHFVDHVRYSLLRSEWDKRDGGDATTAP